jgi:aminoglycoside phosphotransferase (APT) family kinase protein
LRAHAALQQAGLPDAGRLTRVANTTNEVWMAGDYVLRINRAGNARGTLRHERRALETLASIIPVPQAVSYGEATFGEWIVLRRVRGQELSRTWPGMSDRQRRAAIAALGQALQRLHRVDARAAGLEMPPVPVEPVIDVLARVARLAYVETGLIRDAAELLTSTMGALDEHPTTLIHGDLHFENVLWDGEQLTAIIDWEFARAASPDVELDVMMHSLANPALHVSTDYAGSLTRQDYECVVDSLRTAYPELFAHPRLAERLTIYRLGYDARALLQDPPDRPVDELSRYHPYRRLQRVVEGRSDLRWTLTA